MNDGDIKHLECLQRHIDNVQKNMLKVAKGLIEAGRSELYLPLLGLSQIHDNSKYRGIEWKYLRTESKDDHLELFTAALESHWSNNPHHPEYWPGGITDMSSVYLAEMVCDTVARSGEFGTDYREWLKTYAAERYGFTLQGRVYKELKFFTELLLEKPFA